MALFLEQYELTDEGRRLIGEIPKEIIDKCRVVYEFNEKEEGWLFKTFWSPNEIYDENDIVLPLQSVYSGMDESNGPVVFVNVIGSSGDSWKDDSYIWKSWIGMLEAKYQLYNQTHSTNYCARCCCTDGKAYYYSSSGTETPIDNFCASNTYVGGHIIINETEPRRVGRNMNVDLLPICSTHNTAHIKTNRIIDGHMGGYDTGTDYYMKSIDKVLVMHMKNYHPKTKVQNYFDKYGLNNIVRINRRD